MTKQSPKHGVLLINLGTPSAATPKAVKAFLKQFLSDRRVVDFPKLLWQIVLRGIILNVRPKKVAKAYQSVWTEAGSPLMAISLKQAAALQQALGSQAKVALGMTYGDPSIKSALEALKECEHIVVLPLYPQNSSTTTAAAFDALAAALNTTYKLPKLSFINDYHDNPDYIDALVHSVEQHWQAHGRASKLVFSYHGIPKRYVTNGDAYQAQCERTTELVAKQLGLSPDEYQLCYQSRFGREPWLQPYLDGYLEEYAQNDDASVDIISPAFSADCLETLEELAQENCELFLQSGGKSYRYITCLNDSKAHVNMMCNLVKKYF